MQANNSGFWEDPLPPFRFGIDHEGESVYYFLVKPSFFHFIFLIITKEKTVMRDKLVIIFMTILFASPLSAQELTGTLQQIKKSGQIRIGYRESRPPMSFLDKDGNPTGYSLDLCKCIATEVENQIGAGVKIVYVPVTAKGRFKALTDNKIDILCGATTKTLSRSELVDFTQLTFVTGASLMTLNDDKARESAGFSGKKIGVVDDTTTAVVLKKLVQETSTDAEVVLFNSVKDGIDALRKKKIDAFSADQVVLIGIAFEAQDPMEFVIAPNVFSFEPFALAVRRNDADFRLVADRVISDLCRSNKILEIYDKWIGQVTLQRLPIFDAMIQLNATPE
jgi:ABC-type amino acid transport substrate-binding protein